MIVNSALNTCLEFTLNIYSLLYYSYWLTGVENQVTNITTVSHGSHPHHTPVLLSIRTGIMQDDVGLPICFTIYQPC